MSDKGKIKCELDSALVHSIELHLKKYHPSVSLEEYQRRFPSAPLLSEIAKDAIRKKRADKEAEKANAGARQPLTDLFGFPAASVTNSQGKIMDARVYDRSEFSADDLAWVPKIDPDYIFNIDLTKIALMALELNKPALFWGLHGTGKTTQWEQVCARTNRPFQRVQHTVNTEEAHITGQYIVVSEVTVGPDGKDHVHAVTKFNPGPLALAMKYGWVYCADEYDFGMPSVLAVYQPVMEGKPLIIKDAPPEWRVIEPHPNFRFVATGNTNGGGDETGLYQGTQIQNAANYSRFAVTKQVPYMDAKIEAAVVAGKSGIRMQEATKIVQYATEIRKSFSGGQISNTVSPRELINAALFGVVTGGNWREGLALAFANRLSPTDREVVDQYAQRLFG
ncbi:AAA family ATPase [Bradyrhizobium sp. 179]|uniref:AAA family ATPase n=1 Tax=Bradyrhizobium sp. 179 TaxID=2782648 RepID=UPI001FFB6363|nr:MoxR family ATPase [Bradyrhizobium sp. 179]MCK1543299.1 AAA family ATPase [Bradyrhizobium sp. 179]